MLSNIQSKTESGNFGNQGTPFIISRLGTITNPLKFYGINIQIHGLNFILGRKILSSTNLGLGFTSTNQHEI
jgi:hypothetical protein